MIAAVSVPTPGMVLMSLLERLKTETDKGLRIAYASALGNLQFAEAIPALLDILATTENEGARMELALALARVIGGDNSALAHVLLHKLDDLFYCI